MILVRTILAAKLKEFRIASQLTINEVGERIGKSGKTVSAWECGRGQPDADMLLALCDLYGVKSISEFFGQGAGSLSLSPREKEILSRFRELNEAGQRKILSYAEDLIFSGIYKNVPTHNSVQKNA